MTERHLRTERVKPHMNADEHRFIVCSISDNKRKKSPNGWIECELGNICNLREESVEPTVLGDCLVALYSIPAFDDGRVAEITNAKQIGSTKNRVKPGDVLFCKMNPRRNRVWIVDYFKNEVGLCSSEFLPLVPNEKVLPKFLFYLLKSPNFQKSAMEKAKAATKSRERINPDDVLKIIISYPKNFEIQENIVVDFERRLALAEKIR